MPVMADLRMNTIELTSAPGAGECIGRIEDIRSVDDMPDLPGFEKEGEFSPREIMREWGVSRHAAITYHLTPDQEVVFVAIEIDGEWYDLHRQRLTLEIIGQYEWRQPPS